MSRNACNGEKSPASGDLNCQKGQTFPLLIDCLNGALGFLKTCTEKDKKLQYKLLVYEKVVFV